MYGMSEYLMALHQAEKARLADRARKETQVETRKAEPSPTDDPTPTRGRYVSNDPEGAEACA